MRNFSQMIANLRSSESALYDALVETVGYIHFMYHAKNRKVDGTGAPYWAQLVGAIQTKWVAERIAKLEPKGKPNKGLFNEEADAMMNVAPEISRILNERKQENAAAQIKRAQAKSAKVEAERKARVDAYNATQEPAEDYKVQIESEWAILANGKAEELTHAEYVAVMGFLAQMRASKMLKAA